jgi:hypothetical protein
MCVSRPLGQNADEASQIFPAGPYQLEFMTLANVGSLWLMGGDQDG